MYIVVLMYLIIHSCVAMCVSTMYSGGQCEGHHLYLAGHPGWSSKCLIRLKKQKTSVIINVHNIVFVYTKAIPI